MQVFRLLSIHALRAGILSNGVAVDTSVNVSPELYPAIVPSASFTLANQYTGEQVMTNTSGIAPTTGTNTQTGIANRNSGNAWVSLNATVSSGAIPGLLTTSQWGDYITLVPPSNIAQVQIVLTGLLETLDQFKSGDVADGTHTLFSNQVRNGARVAIQIDQQAPVLYDTSNTTLTATIDLDGVNQHAIIIKHSGLFNPLVSAVGRPVAPIGSSFAGKVSASPSLTQGQSAAAGTYTALWTLTAASASTYTLTKTLPGGSPTTVGTTFTTSITYDTDTTIPGVAFEVNGPLVTGDTATFTTDVVMTSIKSVAFYTPTGSAAGEYISPILDSGNPETQWFLYEQVDALFANGPSVIQATLTTANTLQNLGIGGYTPPAGQPIPPTMGPETYILNANPDPTTNGGAQTYSTLVNGQSTTLTLTGSTLPSSGLHVTDAGLMNTPPGRYAQFSIQLNTNTQGATAWARQFEVYSWVPTTQGNPLLLGKFGLPPNWGPGFLMQSYYGSLLTFVADSFADINDYAASFGVSTATGTLLLAKGQDLNENHILGEPSSAYQVRLTTSLQAKNITIPPTSIITSGTGTPAAPLVTPGTGNMVLSPVTGEQGTLYFIAQQVAQLVNGATPVLTATVNSSTGLSQVTGGSVIVSQLAGRGVSITLPNPPYAGLPGLAYGTTGGVDNPAKALLKQFCQSLMPTGTLFNPNSSTYLNFGPFG